MLGRNKWSRRRGDNRLGNESEYELIQSIESDSRDEMAEDLIVDQDMQIPEFAPEPTEESKPQAAPRDDTPPQTLQPSKDMPRIFALLGATGGVGTTCMATQLAHEFAIRATSHRTQRQRPTDPTVCLIDLDFESGACAHHLDLMPSLSLEDLCGPAEQIDKAFTQALVSTHESGISLLATPNINGANARVNPQTVLAMLDAASELYDIIIIDLPRYEQRWTRAVMRSVDVLTLTCELTIPSLHAARERLSKLPETANTCVTISKHERRSFRNKLRLSDAETALGQSIFTTICQDPDTTREALNCGEPAGAIRPESRFVKDVRKLADSLRHGHISTDEKAA